jgi:hypothetical protein
MIQFPKSHEWSEKSERLASQKFTAIESFDVPLVIACVALHAAAASWPTNWPVKQASLV